MESASTDRPNTGMLSEYGKIGRLNTGRMGTGKLSTGRPISVKLSSE
jgi:hypothetical protein